MGRAAGSAPAGVGAPGIGVLGCAALALVAVLLLTMLPGLVHQDTWLGLVGGREVARGGIPGHETLTIAAHGRPWIDQQWLAQLVMYELERLGGIALVGVVSALLVVAAIGGAGLAAQRLGARGRSVGWVAPLAVCGLAVGLEVRTQAYAYPLFVALVYLLAADSRTPSRRVWWCLPLLVLWGNLHGSAVMAAGLVSLRGLVLAWARRGELTRSVRGWGKPAGLAVGAPLCLLATPYGLSVVSYYRATLFNHDLYRLIGEWRSVTSDTAPAIVFFLIVAAAVVSLIRDRSASTPWDRCALLALAVGALVAVRNLPWLALGVLVLLPVWTAPLVPAPGLRRRRWGRRPWGRRPWGHRVAVALAAFAAVWLLEAGVMTFTRSSASLEPRYPPGALVAVRQVLSAHPAWRVYADDTYADWLLWALPEVRGRIATDVRFELLSSTQLQAQVRLKFHTGPHWAQAARGYRLLLLDSSASPAAVTGFEHEPGARTIYEHGRAVVIARG